MTEAEATPARAESRPSGVHGWRWAVATMTVVALVLGATFALHSAAARLRRPPDTPAPSLPPLTVLAVTPPDADYELTALDSSLGRIVALAADRQPQCPPRGACPAAPALTHLDVLDGTTGKVLASTPLTGEAYAEAATAITVDEQTHRAYVVGPGRFAAFSLIAGGNVFGRPINEAGAFVWGGSLPALSPGASWVGVAFDDAHQQLLAMGSDGTLARCQYLFPPQPTSSTNEPVGTYNGLVLDARDGIAFTVRRGSSGQGATLLAIDPTTLATVAQATLPANAVLGPLDPTTGAVTLLGADGKTYSATYANGNLILTANGPASALALGWNPALGHTYIAHADDVQVLDASGKPVAALPLRRYGGPALLTDPTRHLLYLNATGGSLIIAQDAATSPTRVPNAATAILLARAALANYLPNTNQTPPFLDSETFWPGVVPATDGGVATARRPLDFSIHFSDLGWTGPYAGTAETSVTPLTGQPGAYHVTFTITWEQLFARTHAWTLTVAPTGAVSYVSDSGDAIP